MARDLPTFTEPNRTGELQLHFFDKVIRRDLSVARVEDVTPRYRRIVFTGDILTEGFPFTRFAPLDHLRVYFPNPSTGKIVAYREVSDDEWELDGTGDPIHRDYTVRGWDPDAQELTLDFALHEHGVAARWASNAVPGDPLVVNGPSAHWHLPENYTHYLVAGDETALPAICRIIEEAPAESHVTAVVEVTDATDEQPLQGQSALDLQWVHRATAPVADGHLSPLETALRSRGLPADPAQVFVVIAGEAGALKPIRRFYRAEMGLEKGQILVDGYWKRGTTSFDHHDVDFDED